MEDLARESTAREPVKGLRRYLRNKLRKLGVVGKFRTDLLRGGTLMVRSTTTLELPIFEFRGHPVKFQLVSE